MTFRSKVIKLAYQKPELRKDLLPLLVTAAVKEIRNLRNWERHSLFGSKTNFMYIFEPYPDVPGHYRMPAFEGNVSLSWFPNNYADETQPRGKTVLLWGGNSIKRGLPEAAKHWKSKGQAEMGKKLKTFGPAEETELDDIEFDPAILTWG